MPAGAESSALRLLQACSATVHSPRALHLSQSTPAHLQLLSGYLSSRSAPLAEKAAVILGNLSHDKALRMQVHACKCNNANNACNYSETGNKHR